MTKPNIKVDWTLNISSLGAALVFAVGCIGSWYTLKEDLAVTKATTELRFHQLDSSLNEVKTDLKEMRKDVQQAVK